MNHSELKFQSGLNGVAHVVKELQDLAKELLRQAAILQNNFELVYEADEERVQTVKDKIKVYQHRIASLEKMKLPWATPPKKTKAAKSG